MNTSLETTDIFRVSQLDINGTPQTYFTYDTAGKVTATSHADNAEHKFYYDAKGR